MANYRLMAIVRHTRELILIAESFVLFYPLSPQGVYKGERVRGEKEISFGNYHNQFGFWSGFRL
jgi:hypothetical protein